MKLIERAPWNVKPGDTIAVYSYPDQPRPDLVTVKRRTRERGIFTGATVWRFFYASPIDPTREDWTTAHGIRRSHHPKIADWPAEKLLVPAPTRTHATP